MNEEFDALVKNQTLELIQKPKDASPISFKWVYNITRNIDGSVESPFSGLGIFIAINHGWITNKH